MNNRILTLLLILFESFAAMANTNILRSTSSFLMPPRIDASDYVVFDMSTAVMSGNHIDIPVYCLSGDTILALDFALKYDETNLTFDSIINYKSYLLTLANFNTSDRFLRFTSSSKDFQRIENNKPLFAIRFHFNSSSPCKKISSTDFNSIAVYLNGDPCNYTITTPPPFKVPLADFTFNKPCLGANVKFFDATLLLKDTISSWSWNFGNGSTSSSKNPTTTYSTKGTYTVTFISTSSAGCTDTESKVIYVNPSPVVNFIYSSDCSTGNIAFTDRSTIASGSIINNWKWDFGDNQPPSQDQNPLHNYELGGSHSVTHTSVSDSGCTATISKSIVVNTLSALFKNKGGCVNASINFKDSSTSTISSGAITKWKWYFGDGKTSSDKNPSYTYTDTGAYVVSLKVSNLTCSDSIASSIVVQEKPKVQFSENKTSGCMPLTVAFTDTSKTYSGSSYLWTFDETRTDTVLTKNIEHTYINNGAYTVKHTVITSAGCTDSLIKTSYINVFGAVASYTASSKKTKIQDATITFTNVSTSYSDWWWNFGDSTYSTNKTPIHTFKEVGVYNVCLVGKNPNGCASNFCDSITIINPNMIGIPNAFTPNNDNLNDILKVRGGPIEDMELKIFNEWGNLLFLSNTQNDGWDGNFKGTPQPMGTYEYTLKGNMIMQNERINIHGVVNLIR